MHFAAICVQIQEKVLEQYNAGGIFIDRENNVTVTDNLKESVQLTTDTFKLA